MIRARAPLAIGLVLAVLSACVDEQKATEEAESATNEEVGTSGTYRLTLTEKAVQRLGVQTSEVTTGSGGKLVFPYSALIYDLYGDIWVYVSPEACVFTRRAVTVRAISGDQVTATEGPEAGTLVASVGTAELYGEETGIGK